MFSAENPSPISIKIEKDNHNFLTKVYSEGKTLQSERFNTEAAAVMAFDFFCKKYSLKG